MDIDMDIATPSPEILPLAVFPAPVNTSLDSDVVAHTVPPPASHPTPHVDIEMHFVGVEKSAPAKLPDSRDPLSTSPPTVLSVSGAATPLTIATPTGDEVKDHLAAIRAKLLAARLKKQKPKGAIEIGTCCDLLFYVA